MTLDLFLDLLQSHLLALQSSAWPRPHGLSTGPAIYFDSADTQALIAELTRLKVELDDARASRAAAAAFVESDRSARSPDDQEVDRVRARTGDPRGRRPRRLQQHG